MQLRDLSRRERRQLGILPWQLTRTTLQLARDGVDIKRISSDELAQLLMAEVQADNADAWQRVRDTVGERDWEEFFAAFAEFIKDIAPVILEIILMLL